MHTHFLLRQTPEIDPPNPWNGLIELLEQTLQISVMDPENYETDPSNSWDRSFETLKRIHGTWNRTIELLEQILRNLETDFLGPFIFNRTFKSRSFALGNCDIACLVLAPSVTSLSTCEGIKARDTFKFSSENIWKLLPLFEHFLENFYFGG